MSAVALAAQLPPFADTPGWSSSDPAHWCLRDRERTEALMAAVERAVRPGDTVVEPGAGSGILSLAAAAAGAARVYAVELDPLLAGWLGQSVALNGFSDRITVVAGNALSVDLPRPADVVVAELIDTGLIDEVQVPVLNAFHARGVVGPRTRLVPERYATSVELVDTVLAAVRPGDAVMVKGSLSMKMALVVKALKERYGASPTAHALKG